MNEMMSYVFSTLQKNEVALMSVGKALKSQTKINKNFTLFMVLGTVYIYVAERRHKEQEKKIKELRTELNELMWEKAEEGVKAEEQ